MNPPLAFQQNYVNIHNLVKNVANCNDLTNNDIQSTTPSNSSHDSKNNFSRELKRIRDARYKQLKRLMQTEEQKQEQLERKRIKNSSMTDEQREIRRRRDCERRRLRWQSLPSDIRSERRARASMKARERRLRMTTEQRERKKIRDRENARRRRLRKKSDGQNLNQSSSSLSNVGGSVDAHQTTSLNDVSWIMQQQAPWMMKIEPEDYSLMPQKRF